MGPWYHGSWNPGRGGDGQKVGDIDFGSPTGKYFREEIQAPWFAYWLKGKGKLDLAEATVFESGSNRLEALRSPGRRRRGRRGSSTSGPAGSSRSTRPPRVRRACRCTTAYVSDPAHPVPYRKRPIELTYDSRGSHWRPWLYEDQRFVDGRPDILVWRTEPLTEDLTIGGDIAAHLYRLHHRQRRRLGGEAHRRLPRHHHRGTGAGRLRVHGVERDHARPLPPGLRPRAADRAELRSTSTSSTCTSRATPSGRATGSWSRCRAPGSRCTTGIRRRSCPTSSTPRRATSGRRRTASTGTAAIPSYIDLPVLGAGR